MNLFKKKCGYCKNKIEKEKEIFRDVKNPVFIGTRKKTFCCEEHADNYEKEIKEYIKNCKTQGGNCCG